MNWFRNLTCTHTHTHTHKHKHTHTHTHTCTHAHTHAHAHICTHTHIDSGLHGVHFALEKDRIKRLLQGAAETKSQQKSGYMSKETERETQFT